MRDVKSGFAWSVAPPHFFKALFPSFVIFWSVIICLQNPVKLKRDYGAGPVQERKSDP